MVIQNALREQEKFGMEPLKDLKGRRESGTMNPRPQAKVKKGGKGKGGSTQRNLGKRKAEDTSKLPCRNWSRGNGFCKYAGACRYSHDGPKGGGTTSTTMAVTNKRIKLEKNKKPSLVITEKGGEKNGREVSLSESSDEEDHLYQLIRGVPTAMVVDRSGQSKRRFCAKQKFYWPKFYKTDEKGRKRFFLRKSTFSRTR